MDRFRSQRRVQIDDSPPPKFDDDEDRDHGGAGVVDGGGMRMRTSARSLTEDQEPFMGVKVRRKTSFHREYRGDYVDVPSHPYLMKILQKQGHTFCTSISIYVYRFGCFSDCNVL